MASSGRRRLWRADEDDSPAFERMESVYIDSEAVDDDADSGDDEPDATSPPVFAGPPQHVSLTSDATPPPSRRRTTSPSGDAAADATVADDGVPTIPPGARPAPCETVAYQDGMTLDEYLESAPWRDQCSRAFLFTFGNVFGYWSGPFPSGVVKPVDPLLCRIRFRDLLGRAFERSGSMRLAFDLPDSYHPVNQTIHAVTIAAEIHEVHVAISFSRHSVRTVMLWRLVVALAWSLGWRGPVHVASRYQSGSGRNLRKDLHWVPHAYLLFPSEGKRVDAASVKLFYDPALCPRAKISPDRKAAVFAVALGPRDGHLFMMNPRLVSQPSFQAEVSAIRASQQLLADRSVPFHLDDEDWRPWQIRFRDIVTEFFNEQVDACRNPGHVSCKFVYVASPPQRGKSTMMDWLRWRFGEDVFVVPIRGTTGDFEISGLVSYRGQRIIVFDDVNRAEASRCTSLVQLLETPPSQKCQAAIMASFDPFVSVMWGSAQAATLRFRGVVVVVLGNCLPRVFGQPCVQRFFTREGQFLFVGLGGVDLDHGEPCWVDVVSRSFVDNE
jgi:hypothetical protein